MSQRALGAQFDPDEFDTRHVGPAEAREIANPRTPGLMPGPEARKMKIEGHQQQLFPVKGSNFMLEPHQQTRRQFADDPRTWWHGRYSEALPKTGGPRNAGIHVGSFGSSDKRRRDLGPSRKYRPPDPETGMQDRHPQEWRSYPVRLQGEPHNFPDRPGPDEGATWSSKRGVYYYTNEVEDPGSVSALVPTRKNLLTHSQAVREARTHGLYVHPAIEWEQKQLGRKEYDPTRRDPQAILREMPHSWEGPQQQHMFNPAFPGNEKRDMYRRQQSMENEARNSIQQQQWEKDPRSKMTPEEHLEHMKATIPGLKEHLEKAGT